MTKKAQQENAENVAIAATLHEITQRYGEAGAEFIKGFRGIDNQTGQVFDRSLISISQSKVNPEFAEQNIKQQAGYSAEVASVSKKNAEHIIADSKDRAARSEDLPGYGKNNTKVDIVETHNGIPTTSQMKFVGDHKTLLRKIAKGEGGGKTDLSRYLDNDKLALPTEQVDSAKQFCRQEAEKLQQESEKLRQLGKLDLAQKKMQQAENYKQLETKIDDAGLSTEEAIRYRNNPELETIKDIAQTGHRAGIQGAKFGAAIGGSISVINNIIAVRSGDKEFSEALLDSSKDTLIASAVGYGTGATGAVIKSVMTQSSSKVVQGLSKTGLPAMIVSACIATGKHIRQYAQGNLTEAELAQEVGLTASGMLSASFFTTIGQVAIPVPVLGGLVGGMVGYALTNTFYQSFFDTFKTKNIAIERRKEIEMQCATAKAIAKQYEQHITALFDTRVKELKTLSDAMFKALEDPDISSDQFCLEMNRFAETLGAQLSIKNMAELEAAMQSEQPLKI